MIGRDDGGRTAAVLNSLINYGREKRRSDSGIYERLPAGTQLLLRWGERKGVQRQISARAFDVSKSGLQGLFERAIAAGTLVNVYTAGFVPIGRTSVRQCTIKGLDYSIGLYMPGQSTPDL